MVNPRARINGARHGIGSTTIALSLLVGLTTSGAAAGLTTVSNEAWDESAVRRVLQVFAYGGAATDDQVEDWADMRPRNAIRQMLTFAPRNRRLSPAAQHNPGNRARSLAQLQTWWSSTQASNPTRPSRRRVFSQTVEFNNGNVRLADQGLQQTWIAAVARRGLNPFRHKVGLWLTNYQMAVSLRNVEPTLIRALYDDSLDRLATGANYEDVLGGGASSAAIARQYGHNRNRFNQRTGVFTGNDDFAREFHQLFFRNLGATEDPEYHENVTIENTARVLTGMQLDKAPNAWGTTNSNDWWLEDINFTNHRDALGRNVNNINRHHAAGLEVLGEVVEGANAGRKVTAAAAVAIDHPESLDNLPLYIIGHFADDDIDTTEAAAVRQAWRDMRRKNLLSFLRDYATSTTFHSSSAVKHRTAISRNMTVHNLNTVDNEEGYASNFAPRSQMQAEGAELFKPAHAVFGGQTGLDAASSAAIFKAAYNSVVETPGRLISTARSYVDADGSNQTWRKDWARVMPLEDRNFEVRSVAQWLWERFISDDGANYGPLEEAHLVSLLATGRDLGSLARPGAPDTIVTLDEVERNPLRSQLRALSRAPMLLNDSRTWARREANRRVGLGVSFISITPFMFATQGR